MPVGAVKSPAAMPIGPLHRTPGVSHESTPWTNPAAAAALRSSVEMLKSIEDGMVKHYTDAGRVRAYVPDLRATHEVFTAASEALLGDGHKENDQFLPLINRAGTSVSTVEVRLSSKDIVSTWPQERDDILSALKYARVLSDNAAKQLDPTTVRPG